MKRKIRETAKVFFLILIAAAASCSRQNNRGTADSYNPAPVVNVRIHEVTTGDIDRHILLSGEVCATDIVRITPDTSGTLSEIMIQPGDRISAGQVVARVDPSRPGMSYAQSPVRSKSSGTVIRVPAVAGNQVTPGIVIAEIGNLTDLEIESRVPERYLPALVPGLSARIASRAYPDDRIEAHLSEISPVVDPGSRTVAVTFKPEVTEKIRPGQAVTVDLILERHSDVILIPGDAVTERNGGEGVFLARDGRAEWRDISTGLHQSGMTEVKEGLEEGDPVIIAGIELLTDRIPVRVLE